MTRTATDLNGKIDKILQDTSYMRGRFDALDEKVGGMDKQIDKLKKTDEHLGRKISWAQGYIACLVAAILLGGSVVAFAWDKVSLNPPLHISRLQGERP